MLEELYAGAENRRITETTNGATGQRIFKVEWASRFTATPKVGDPFPGYPSLKCVQRDISGLGKPGQTTSAGIPSNEKAYDYARVVCDYATRTYEDNIPVISWDFETDVLETGFGMYWASSNPANPEYLEQGLSIPIPVMIKTYTIVQNNFDERLIGNLLGHVNKYSFDGFNPEQVLFAGAPTTQEWDNERKKFKYRTSYTFKIRGGGGWNTIWRAAKVQTDANGTPLKYTSGAKAGQWRLNQGGFYDRPIYKDENFNTLSLYPAADLNPVLGRPPMGV